MQVKVRIKYISAERFWEQEHPALGGVNISTNVNIAAVEQKGADLSTTFVVTIAYNPSIAQINIKGEALVSGSPEELEKVKEDYKEKKSPPPMLIQAITNTSLIEATVISRTVNIVPPVPLPSIEQAPKPDKERPSYVG